MEKSFWNANFEWFEQEPLSESQIRELPIEEQVQREIKFARILSAYKGRWVMVKNQDVIASGETLSEITLPESLS